MGAIDISSIENNWNVEVLVNDSMFFKDDSGAQCNVILFETLKANVSNFKILPTKAKLSAYTGHDIPVIDGVYLEVEFDSVQLIKFSNAIPILGLNEGSLGG